MTLNFDYSRIRCNFWQCLKIFCSWRSDPSYIFRNLRWLWTLRTEFKNSFHSIATIAEKKVQRSFRFEKTIARSLSNCTYRIKTEWGGTSGTGESMRHELSLTVSSLDKLDKRNQSAFHTWKLKAELAIKWLKLKATNAVPKTKAIPWGWKSLLARTEDYNKKIANSAKTERWKCHDENLKPNLEAEQACLPKTEDQQLGYSGTKMPTFHNRSKSWKLKRYAKNLSQNFKLN